MHSALLHRDRVYLTLKSRLLRGDYAFDARLAETALAGALGVSRTPVREALHRLWSEGLVERHPEGGFRPVLPDVEVIRDLYDVRIALERHALTRPLGGGTTHNRQRLTQLHLEWSALGEEEPVADPEFVLLDEGFHVALAEASGNPALAEMLQGVNERIRVVRTHDFLTAGRITATIGEHLGILEALLEGRPDVALARFDLHLAQSISVVEQRSAQACLRMIQAGRAPQ